MVIFFFASAGASSAYLTASEVFPMETRALCIAFFYAIGTAVGGITGPLLFGKLIDYASASGDITGIAPGYFLGAGLMIAGGIVAAFLGVRAEGQSLERHRPAAHRRGRRDRGSPSTPTPDPGTRTRPDTPARHHTGGHHRCRCHPRRPPPRGLATARSSTRWGRSSAPSRTAGPQKPDDLQRCRRVVLGAGHRFERALALAVADGLVVPARRDGLLQAL